MLRRGLCIRVRRIWAWCLAIVMVISLGMPVSVRAETTVLPTTAEEPSEGCVFIGIPGSYITDTANALKRINEIRYEACVEGVKSPATGEPLTIEDYVPIKWSSAIEAIARIRASEAGVAFSHSAIKTGHARLNDAGIWEFDYPAGINAGGEIIAYNGGTDVISSINQWYGEKNDWVTEAAGKTTGHYTQMIDPRNTYIGLATFYSDSINWKNTTLGRFGKGNGGDETQMPAVDSCVQTVEIKTTYISDISLAGTTVKLGSMGQCTLKASVSGMKKDVEILEGAVWTSSNPAVATVDNHGLVTGISTGGAVITVKAGELSATCTITVTCDHVKRELRNQKDASITEAGYTGDSYCTACGSLVEAGSEIPKLNPPESPASTTATVNKITYKLNQKKKTAICNKVSKSFKGTLTIPASIRVNGITYKVTSISANAFKNNKKITKVIIGKNVKSIGNNAFYGCKKLKTIKITTKKLTKGNVGKNAFKGIYSKVKIQVPASKLKSYKKLLKARGISGKASIKK